MSIFEPVVRAVAGLYQNTVTEVSDGQIRSTRMSPRRGLVVANDLKSTFLSNTSLSGYDDIMVLRNATMFGGSYIAPTTAFFDGTDAGLDTTPMFIKIPVLPNWKNTTLGVYNYLSQNITISLYSIPNNEFVNPAIQAFSVGTLGNGAYCLSSGAGGSGAASGFYSVPALASPTAYLILSITPAVDPSTGYFRVTVIRTT